MGDKYEQMNEADFRDYKITYDLIQHLENSDMIDAGSKPSFNVVRNYLANAIAHFAIINL